MIFYWIAKSWRWLVWIFKPPTARDVARIDQDAKCPVCGAELGKIQCVHVVTTVEKEIKPQAVLAKHECSICGARWFEKPVMSVSPKEVMPAADSEFVRAA